MALHRGHFSPYKYQTKFIKYAQNHSKFLFTSLILFKKVFKMNDKKYFTY